MLQGWFNHIDNFPFQGMRALTLSTSAGHSQNRWATIWARRSRPGNFIEILLHSSHSQLESCFHSPVPLPSTVSGPRRRQVRCAFAQYVRNRPLQVCTLDRRRASTHLYDDGRPPSCWCARSCRKNIFPSSQPPDRFGKNRERIKLKNVWLLNPAIN